MASSPTKRIDPLPLDMQIVNEDGTPTQFFRRQWLQQRGQNGDVDTLVQQALADALEALGYLDNSIVAGTGLDGGGKLNAGNVSLDLADTTVTPDTYGDATHVAQFTVDQQGRITSAVDVAISGGGGGGGVSPFWETEPTPPSSSGLTLVKGGSTTAALTDTTRGFVLDVTRSSGGDRGALASQANPNGAGNPFVMTALFVPNAMSLQYDSFGFFVSDSGTGRIEQWCFVVGQVGTQRWSAIDSYAGGNVIPTKYDGWGPVWLQLELTATDLLLRVSFDGETWSQIFSETKTAYVGTVTDCGIEVMTNPNSSTQYQGQVASVHIMSYSCV